MTMHNGYRPSHVPLTRRPGIIQPDSPRGDTAIRISMIVSLSLLSWAALILVGCGAVLLIKSIPEMLS